MILFNPKYQGKLTWKYQLVNGDKNSKSCQNKAIFGRKKIGHEIN